MTNEATAPRETDFKLQPGCEALGKLLASLSPCLGCVLPVDDLLLALTRSTVLIADQPPRRDCRP